MYKTIRKNSSIEKFFSDETYRTKILAAIKGVKHLRFAEEIEEVYFFRYLKVMNGNTLKKALEEVSNVADFDFEYELAPLKHMCLNEKIYSLVADSRPYSIITRPGRDYLQSEMGGYLSRRHRAILRGDRYNCDTSISESLPCFYESRYYKYFPNKIHEKAKPKAGGDGVFLKEDEIVEVEVKYTASGGVRQTFSQDQVDKCLEFIVVSIERSDLDDTARSLEMGTSISLPVTFYGCRDKFRGALQQEVEAKKARKGTGRYEMSNMIEKIEKGNLYCAKETYHLEIPAERNKS
jgi:hypothetical protein